jgi:hypothetical protein
LSWKTDDFQGKTVIGEVACKSLLMNWLRLSETGHYDCRTNLAGGGGP